MSLSQVDICGKESGPIWSKNPVPNSSDGLLLEVSNTKLGLTSQGRRMQFTKVGFGFHGDWFVGGDQLGNVYRFDMANNKLRLVFKAGQACTAIACCISRPNEVLVALSDYSVKCIDVESSQIVAILRGHEACVHSLSLHSSGRYVLAVSSRDSVLWDLDTFTRCRTLNGGEEVGVQDVFFIPLSNTIVSCFKDDSIHAWESTTMEYKFQIPPPFGPTPHYRAFAVPHDGRVLVGGGRCNFLHVWTMDDRQLLRIIQLPPKIRFVKQLVFLPDRFDGGTSETLGFLAQDGIMRFINIHSCKQLFQIGAQHEALTYVQSSPLGKYLVGVSEHGSLLVYDAATLRKDQDSSQPPAPLVKVVERNVTSPVKPAKVVKSRSATSQRHSSRSNKPKVTSLIPQDKKEAGISGDSSSLDKMKLLSILKGYGEYPEKYRMFIWRNLLDLPENFGAYSGLLEKGTHPSYLTLHKQYPIKSRKLLRVLQRALSALAYWSSIFGEMQYLPGLAFPFVKMFQNNQMVTFEILACILTNWCGQWFEFFPNSPLNILAMVENCLAHHDPHLLQHFIDLDITSQLYAWPLLETLFSEVLSKGEWLRVWDNIISHHPGYLLLMIVAYLTTARHTLFNCKQAQDFQLFFRHQNSLDIGKVILEANLMHETTPTELHPEHLVEPFVPLTKGTYPIFNKYPKFIVDYQVQERRRIRKEEVEYLRERQGALELEHMIDQRKQEEEAWYSQQQQLMNAEEQRRKIMQVEEKKLTDQRARLQALKRELRVKELHVMDAARRRFLGHQQLVKEAELKRLDDQIKKKVQSREKETKAVLQDLEIRTVELEGQKARLEEELGRCQQEMCQRLRAEGDSELHKTELDKSMLQQALEEDMEREVELLDIAQAKLATAQAHRVKEAAVQEAKAKRSLREMKHNVQMEAVVEKNRLNQIRKKNVQGILVELQQENKAMTSMDADLSNTTDSSVCLESERFGADVMMSTINPGATFNTTSTTTARSTFASHLDDTSHLTTDSALLWSSQRALLDKQEAVMLSRIRELREKVASQMKITAKQSSSSAP